MLYVFVIAVLYSNEPVPTIENITVYVFVAFSIVGTGSFEYNTAISNTYNV